MTAQDLTGSSGTTNPPGQPRLRRRVDTHAGALARMHADLADPRHDRALRSLAAQGSDEIAVALLDTWAVVADVVAFYSERIATEGFLRTATELRSVRELARTLGHALRPGVAAQADLVFTVETAPGAPQTVTVPAGTPVQSVPGPGQVPQTFETSAELELRGVWNTLAVLDATPQSLTRGTRTLWLRAAAGTVKPGDSLLIRGVRTGFGTSEQRQARRAVSVTLAPDGLEGWVEVTLDEGIGVTGPGFPAVLDEIHVDAFATRARLFGWNAPDPNLLVVDGVGPPGASDTDSGTGVFYEWDGYPVTSPLEVDGEHPALLDGSWLVLAQGEEREPYLVSEVVPDGAAKWTLSGPTTLVTPDPTTGFDIVRPAASQGPVRLGGAGRSAGARPAGTHRPPGHGGGHRPAATTRAPGGAARDGLRDRFRRGGVRDGADLHPRRRRRHDDPGAGRRPDQILLPPGPAGPGQRRRRHPRGERAAGAGQR